MSQVEGCTDKIGLEQSIHSRRVQIRGIDGEIHQIKSRFSCDPTFNRRRCKEYKSARDRLLDARRLLSGQQRWERLEIAKLNGDI